MPTKFKPDSFRYEGRGIARKQILEKSYIKSASKDELFEYINNSSGKPKIKRKCKNELIRRGIKILHELDCIFKNLFCSFSTHLSNPSLTFIVFFVPQCGQNIGSSFGNDNG